MNKQLEKVTESPELIEELYHHWWGEYMHESLFHPEDEEQKNFAFNKYQHYKELNRELCHD